MIERTLRGRSPGCSATTFPSNQTPLPRPVPSQRTETGARFVLMRAPGTSRRVALQPSVDIATMSNPHDNNTQDIVVDLIKDAVRPDPNTVQVVLAAKFLVSDWTGVVGQCGDLRSDTTLRPKTQFSSCLIADFANSTL
jgi:hypothetical protein